MKAKESLLARLETPVDVDRLIEKLSFDLDGFETANLEQPKLRLEAGKYLTQAVLERSRAEYKLELVGAQLGLDYRDTAAKRTEKAIAEKITIDRRMQVVRKRAYMAKVREVWAKQLVEVYDQRLGVLNNITKIRTGEMATELRGAKEKAAVDTMLEKADRIRNTDWIRRGKYR